MDSIPDQLVEETRSATKRPRLFRASLFAAMNAGVVFGVLLRASVDHAYLYAALFGAWVLLNIVFLIDHFRDRRSQKVLDDPEWPQKVRQMRRSDDAEKYPLVAAALALEKAEAAKRRTAEGRHGENRELREMVVKWWMENKDSGITKDKAAEEMAGKLVPLKYATVREYLKGL